MKNLLLIMDDLAMHWTGQVSDSPEGVGHEAVRAEPIPVFYGISQIHNSYNAPLPITADYDMHRSCNTTD